MSGVHNPFLPASCKRTIALEKEFTNFNKLYFKGKLPHYGVYLCPECQNFGHGYAGYCSSKDRKIFIRQGISNRATLQTLTHEMAHAKLSHITQDMHGRAFINELRRLRRLGAPLSRAELDLLPDKQTIELNRRNLRCAIFDALVIEKLPARAVPSYLEREFMKPLVEIERVTKIANLIDQISIE